MSSKTTEWVPRSEGCMGNEVPGHWRVTLTCLDGGVVIGCDTDRGVAEFKAQRSLAERNGVALMTPLQQLDKLCQPEYMLPGDVVRAVKLINKLLQGRS